MRVHDAFGQAGRSASIHDGNEIARLDFIRRFGDTRRRAKRGIARISWHLAIDYNPGHCRPISKLRSHLVKNTTQCLGAENDAWLRVIQQRYGPRSEEEWRQRHRHGAKLCAAMVSSRFGDRILSLSESARNSSARSTRTRLALPKRPGFYFPGAGVVSFVYDCESGVEPPRESRGRLY
jgi:hypothetical protein